MKFKLSLIMDHKLGGMGKETINSVKEYRLGGITLCEGKRQNELGSLPMKMIFFNESSHMQLKLDILLV